MPVRALGPRGGRSLPIRLAVALAALTLTALVLLAAGTPASAGAADADLLGPDRADRVPYVAEPANAGSRASGFREAPAEILQFESLRLSPEILTYPTRFDLRTLGRLTPVKDQGSYGTCWAFASLGSLESGLMPGEQWDLSEDNMVYWHGFDWDGYEGGNFTMAAAYLLRWGGPFTEAQDPYDPYIADPDLGDHPTPESLTAQKHVQQVLLLPPRAGATANDDLKYAITTYGAVATSMCWMAGYLNGSTGAYYSTSSSAPNHAVALVGWDDNYSRTNFANQPPGDGAFIVRNSWGATWGSTWGGDGYFHVSYYDTRLAYATNAVFTQAEPTENYASLYQYDPLGYVVSWGRGSPTAWFANRFIGEADESVSAVGFYTPGVNATYEVYAGATLADRQLKARGILMEPGFHTVDFDTPYNVTAGQPFVVAVKLDVPATTRPVAIEHRYADYTGSASADPRQSYVSDDGLEWDDLTTLTLIEEETGKKIQLTEDNVCLKAYTEDSAPLPPTITAPNGGETWPAGSPQTITWTGTRGGTATIELSRDGGATYDETLAADTTNDGNYTWIATTPASSQARVRVTTSVGSDESDAVFSITAVPAGQPYWVAQVTGTPLGLWDVAALGEDRAWAAGDDGTIVGTVDGGAHWTRQRTGVLNDLRGVDFLDDALGYAVGTSGRILRTRDAGGTWVKLSSGASLALNGVDVVDLTRAVAVGREGVFRTADGGATWKHQTSGLADVVWLRAVDFISPQRGWVVGQGGQIFATTNAGGLWRRQASGTTETLEDVTFLTSQSGWAVGRNGTALHTLDGGATWERVDVLADVNLDVNLWDVEFVGAELGWIVGDGGTILKTADGGVTWVLQDLGWTPRSLRGVTMQSEGYGWAAGLGGTALRFWSASGPDDLLPPHTTATLVLDRWFNVPVPLTFSATDPSGVDRTEYRVDGGDWTTGDAYIIEAPTDGTNDGYHWVDYRSADPLGNVESFHTAEARLDTQRPSTSAPEKERVKRYEYVKLTYKVKDALPNAGTAKVTIKIKTLSGSVVRTLSVGRKKVDLRLDYRWRCTIARGTYRFYVYATDPAGNTQSYVGRNTLVVY